MNGKRLLPIGIQDFETIRTRGYLYADKTAVLYRLVTEGEQYFLSRPRRFGKSLLISTLKAYFEGRKDLFQGLAIEGLETEWKTFPVLHFTFTSVTYSKPDALLLRLHQSLERMENQVGMPCTEPDDPGLRFERILLHIRNVLHTQAVVLADEYDEGLLSTEGEERERNRTLLKGVFSNLKDHGDCVRFAFITGITRFTGTTIFSGLIQLNDITLSNKFSTICGITQGDLEATFAPEIDAFAQSEGCSREEMLDRLKSAYDGYLFAAKGERVYNPFSLIRAFQRKEILNYWFTSGTPAFLLKRLGERRFNPRRVTRREIRVSENLLQNYRDQDYEDIIPLLYQTGCLTIAEGRPGGSLTLDFPNDEVRTSFVDTIATELSFLTGTIRPENGGFNVADLQDAIRADDLEGMRNFFVAFFAGLYFGNMKEAEVLEAHIQGIIYTIFTMLGYPAQCEVVSAKGRADCVVQTPKAIYLFEFKIRQGAVRALKQMEDRGYAERYRNDPRPVTCIGIGFSLKQRNITSWAVLRTGSRA